jgi:hypothetical protein
MKHPWVMGALAVTGKLCKEIMDLKQQNNKLEEENRILRGIIAKNITSSPRITITLLPLSFFLVQSFWLYLGLVE